MSDLVTLARRYVALNDELEAVRGEIKRVVLRGGEPHPTQARSKPGATEPHPNAIAAAEIEQKIVEVLKETPGLQTSQIAAATGAPTTSTMHRLKRLRAKGLVQGGGAAGWAVAAPA